MRLSFSTSCTVVGGKLKLFDKDEFARIAGEFADGESLVLTIEQEGRKRTAQQNRFFHGPILNSLMPCFTDYGWTREELKTELCLRFIPVEHTREDGSVVVIPGHTSALDVEPFNQFIESCNQFAAEHGVYIKDSDEWRRAHGKAA